MLNQGLMAGSERAGQGVKLPLEGLSVEQGPAGGPTAVQLHPLGWFGGRHSETPRGLKASRGQDRDKLPHSPACVCCPHSPQEKKRG